MSPKIPGTACARSGSRTRAICVGITLSREATRHETMLTSSESVTAMIISASSRPAERRTAGLEPFPCTT